MKIYFSASLSQIDTYGAYYKRIANFLEKQGHKVQADHILKKTVEEIYDDTDDDKIEYYKRFLKWINLSDLVVFEASYPSTVNIGHEISIALEKGKPVIVLFHEGKSPIFLEGITSEKLIIDEYNDENLEKTLLSSIEYASEQQDTRFNFFISPKIANYLDWISREKRVPRAVYLRRLIEEDMRDREEQE